MTIARSVARAVASPVVGALGSTPQYAWAFNGTTSEVDFPDQTFSSAGTVMIKVKLNAATPAAAAQTALFEVSDASIVSASHYPFTNGSVYLTVFRFTARVGPLTPNVAIDRTEWHWVIVRSSAANGWEALQGALDGTLYSIGTAAHENFTTNLDAQYIGKNLSGHHLDGTVDRFLVFGADLTDEQIQAVIAGGIGPSPKIVYETNEGSGSTAVDSSGNGNDGTLTNISFSAA